jgi:hypothetical protein
MMEDWRQHLLDNPPAWAKQYSKEEFRSIVIEELINPSNKFGFKHDEFTKIKLSEKLKERWESDRESIISSWKNRNPRIWTNEQKELHKEWMKENNPVFNEECRSKISSTIKQKYKDGTLENSRTSNWKVTSPDGNTIIVRNLQKWCGEMGVSYSLARCGQYGGYTATKI